MDYKEQLKLEYFIWKGAAVQRGLEPGGRGIAFVKAVTRKRLGIDSEH
jgi:hypothetical protein